MKTLLLLIFVVLLAFCGSNKDPVLKRQPYYLLDSTKSIYENFSQGYIDTFSINKTLFRIRSAVDSFNLFALEKYSGNWNLIDTFFARHSSYEFIDLNKDGYPDLFADYRFQQFVYLYNPSKNSFEKTGFFPSEDSDSLLALKSSENLYFDKFYSKYDNWWSYLYTLKDSRRYNLGIIEFKMTYQGSLKDTGYLSVRKISFDTVQTEVEKIRPIDLENFNLKNYWLQNISKFYPNSNMRPNKNFIDYEPDFVKHNE